MQAALAPMLAQTGLTVEVVTINAADVGGGSMGALMSGMILVMPTLMMTILCSVALFVLFRPKKGASTPDRLKAYGTQIAYAVGLSAAIAGLAVLLAVWGGLSIPSGAAFMFLWFASFFLILLFSGALNLAPPLGGLVIVTCFAFGMSSGMFAYEMLPSFWQNWVYPWVPQRFLGDGIRSIIYMGSSGLNRSLLPLLLAGVIGLVLTTIATFLPRRTKEEVTASEVTA